MSTKTKVDLNAIAEKCVALQLTHVAECLGELVKEGVRLDLAPVRFLDLALEREIERKTERHVAASLKLSGLPTGRTLEGFDWVSVRSSQVGR